MNEDKEAAAEEKDVTKASSVAHVFPTVKKSESKRGSSHEGGSSYKSMSGVRQAADEDEGQRFTVSSHGGDLRVRMIYASKPVSSLTTCNTVIVFTPLMLMLVLVHAAIHDDFLRCI